MGALTLPDSGPIYLDACGKYLKMMIEKMMIEKTDAMLAKELDAIPLSERSTNVRRRLVNAWQAMKALPVIASAIRIIEWVKGLLSFT